MKVEKDSGEENFSPSLSQYQVISGASFTEIYEPTQKDGSSHQGLLMAINHVYGHK